MSGGELSWLGGSAAPSAGGTPKNGLAWQLNAADATEGERRARPVGRGVVERVFQPPQALGQPAHGLGVDLVSEPEGVDRLTRG